ncbi:hypothetical protein HYX01_03260 [Candidatus Woesearchaeota archaeon]|nr:hypothetical protein [Candidatus Woesearchaeota archaeon]
MLEFAVFIVLILFVVYTIATFVSYTSLFLNLIVILALNFLISNDIKHHNSAAYLASLFLTAAFFIFSYTPQISYLLELAERMLLSAVSLTLLLIYLFANIVVMLIEFYHKYIKIYHTRQK